MAKLKKRKGYTPTVQNNWAIPTHSTTGYVSANINSGTSITTSNINTGGITFNPGVTGTTITVQPSAYSSSGYVYSFNGYSTEYNSITYEPLHPVGVNDTKTGTRLIVWEP
jgi:hypothetical protein